MTQDEIISMEREAIRDTISQHDQMLKRLWCIAYEEGQRAEREACAKLMDDMAARDRVTNYYKVAANAIRARGEK